MGLNWSVGFSFLETAPAGRPSRPRLPWRQGGLPSPPPSRHPDPQRAGTECGAQQVSTVNTSLSSLQRSGTWSRPGRCIFSPAGARRREGVEPPGAQGRHGGFILTHALAPAHPQEPTRCSRPASGTPRSRRGPAATSVARPRSRGPAVPPRRGSARRFERTPRVT